ncbi:uncharacterized protein G2W53_037572 [Senna tora]|uniref:Uncharacterized protein n=1 Tax=Senna tora TaxID=362788 RepID=A0A834SKP9_9FABA|nr:uncharacterized protein G2W53_037572 [Senna tora]
MSRKLCDKSRPENTALSYADVDHKIRKSVGDNTLKSYRNHQKQVNVSRATEEDELVKYMSNLPSYLERGENIHEKILNVGVLDWGRLEQWQHRHKHILHKGGRSSISTSNTSSSLSTERLSGQSSRGNSSSPFHQRICRPSLRSYFMASTMQDDKSSGENVTKFQNFRGRLEACNRKDLDPNIDKESVISPSDQKREEEICAKLEMGPQDGELEKRVETLQVPNIKTVEQGVLRKSKPIVLLPGNVPQISHFGVSDRRTSLDQNSGASSRTSISERSKELFGKDLNCDISHSCPLPYDVKANCTQAKGSSSLDAESIKIPTATFSAPLTAEMGTSPSKPRKDEERKQTIPTISSVNGHSQGLDQKVKSEKSRSSSPFGRLSTSIGYASKVSGCKECVYVPYKSSIAAARSNSEDVRCSASSYISGHNKPVDAGRSRSSPLRRLLDPVLKPKEANCRHSMESSQKNSALVNKANDDNSHLQPGKELERDRRISFSSINTRDSSKEKKYASSTVQALLRIAVKNGLPLFTFTVDKESNILAATVKTLSTSRKDDCSCIYTFFTFREVKKKNGNWMNQAGKSKGPNYIHQVVAQMKVSNSHFHDLTGQHCVDSSTVKEFVLFSVQLKQGDGQASDYQPNNELAAIVVKIPKAISFINNVHQGGYDSDGQQLVQATVVLPSGVHSLPSRGGPSSLIERWKSGGSCDCGGWDLGCKLKILVNENKSCKTSKPSKGYFAERFELFLQGNGQGNMPALSLTPFKNNGTYSVAFDSSLTLLQAFSICMALMDSNMPYELSGSRNSLEGKIPRETLSIQSDGIKVLRKLEDIPASYISYPPLSPVGRV